MYLHGSTWTFHFIIIKLFSVKGPSLNNLVVSLLFPFTNRVLQSHLTSLNWRTTGPLSGSVYLTNSVKAAAAVIWHSGSQYLPSPMSQNTDPQDLGAGGRSRLLVVWWQLGANTPLLFMAVRLLLIWPLLEQRPGLVDEMFDFWLRKGIGFRTRRLKFKVTN